MRVSVFVTVTVAPATDPPEVSVIVPRTDVVACPQQGIVPANMANNAAATCRAFRTHAVLSLAQGDGTFMDFPPELLPRETLLELCKLKKRRRQSQDKSFKSMDQTLIDCKRRFRTGKLRPSIELAMAPYSASGVPLRSWPAKNR